MQKRLIEIFIAAVLAVISYSYSHASTTTVTLDGIANAGYSADDLTSTYLYVKDSRTSQTILMTPILFSGDMTAQPPSLE